MCKYVDVEMFACSIWSQPPTYIDGSSLLAWLLSSEPLLSLQVLKLAPASISLVSTSNIGFGPKNPMNRFNYEATRKLRTVF